MINNKANFTIAETAARALLLQFEIKSLPVPLDIIHKSFRNLKVRNYTWYAKNFGISIKEVISLVGSDSGCCSKQPNNKYLILYNDTIGNIGHKRWTIAHEIGHYILKHHDRSDKEFITRKFLNKTEYDIFEQEANCFARELLAPTNVLYALRKFNTRDLTNWCDISINASTNILKFFNKGIELGRNYTSNSKIEDLFANFIYQNIHEKQCLKCQNYFVIPGAKHCPVCGYKKIPAGKRENIMIYASYILDENGRALTCPRCENEQINGGEFCKICATPTVNKCTQKEYDMDGDVIGECGTIADGNARFCTICGEKTTYFANKLLEPWDVEHKRLKQEISDADLPF